MGIEVLLGLLSGVNMLKDISVKGGDGESLYEVGARTKQSAGHSQNESRIVAGVRFVKTGRELGVEYGKLGKLLTSLGYSRKEIGVILNYLRGGEA